MGFMVIAAEVVLGDPKPFSFVVAAGILDASS